MKIARKPLRNTTISWTTYAYTPRRNLINARCPTASRASTKKGTSKSTCKPTNSLTRGMEIQKRQKEALSSLTTQINLPQIHKVPKCSLKSMFIFYRLPRINDAMNVNKIYKDFNERQLLRERACKAEEDYFNKCFLFLSHKKVDI